MRRHAAWYTKGVRGAARWRQMLNQALCRDDFERLLEEMLAAELSAANGG
jgi:tRNA-dihydrouridine synthase